MTGSRPRPTGRREGRCSVPGKRFACRRTRSGKSQPDQNLNILCGFDAGSIYGAQSPLGYNGFPVIGRCPDSR